MRPCTHAQVTAADQMYSVDMMVEWRGQQVAVEVEGPFHYMLNRHAKLWGKGFKVHGRMVHGRMGA